MPRWRTIIIAGVILLGSLDLCALGANYILNFQPPQDELTFGVILFFVVIPILGAVFGILWKSIPGFERIIAYLIRTRRP